MFQQIQIGTPLKKCIRGRWHSWLTIQDSLQRYVLYLR